MSSLIKFKHFGERTKKPPLTQPPSPSGFSKNSSTLLPLSFNNPNLPFGFTAINVAFFFFFYMEHFVKVRGSRTWGHVLLPEIPRKYVKKVRIRTFANTL